MPYPPQAFGGGPTHGTYGRLQADVSYGPAADNRLANHSLHPLMRPVAGINEINGQYTTGRIYALPYPGDNTTASGGTATRWAFNFLYNPNAISQSTSINWDLNYDPKDVFTALPNAQTLEFQLLLNRILDVAERDPRLRVPNGTLHDLEYLYRVINGNPVNQGAMGITADKGLLVPTRVLVAFGTHFRFVGYINSINVQHVMFQHGMIPVYTTVDLTLSRALDSSISQNGTDPTANSAAPFGPGGSVYNSQVQGGGGIRSGS